MHAYLCPFPKELSPLYNAPYIAVTQAALTQVTLANPTVYHGT